MKKIVLFLISIYLIIPVFSIYHKIGEYEHPSNFSYLAVSNDRGYLSCGNDSLVVLDVSIPENPQFRSVYDTGIIIHELCLIDTLLFIGSHGSGVQILNVSDSQNPVLLSEYVTSAYIRSINVVGNIAYLCTIMNGIEIVDVSDVYNPQLISNYNNLIDAYSIKIVGDIAYVANGIHGLTVLDISEPQVPQLVRTYQTDQSLHYVDVEGDLMFLGMLSIGLEVLNITDINNIQQLDRYQISQIIFLDVQGGLCHIGDREKGLLVIDYSTPDNLELGGIYNSARDKKSICIYDYCAYLVDDRSDLDIIDISEPDINIQRSSFSESVSVNIVKSINNATFVGDDIGIKVYDLADINNPILLNSVEVPEGVRDFFIDGNIIYLASPRSVYTLNISNLQNLQLGGFYHNGGYGEIISIIYSDSLIYYSTTHNGIRVLDATNPLSLQSICSHFNNTLINDMQISGDIVKAACGWTGLVTFDVSNPPIPNQVCQLDITDYAKKIVQNSQVVYIATGKNGLKVIDTSNMSDCYCCETILPRETSSIDDCFIYNNCLIICDSNWNEISIYDISNPLQPRLVDSFQWNLHVNNIDVEDDILFLANGSNGVSTLESVFLTNNHEEIQEIQKLISLSNFPNPFNPETTISFQLTKSSYVTLKVYNIKGELIETLISGNVLAGSHSYEWKPENVASGVYFCRLSDGKKTVTQKLILLK